MFLDDLKVLWPQSLTIDLSGEIDDLKVKEREKVKEMLCQINKIANRAAENFHAMAQVDLSLISKPDVYEVLFAIT